MPEFESLRDELRQASARAREAAESAARRKADLERLRAAKTAFERRANLKNPEDQRRAAVLAERIAGAEGEVRASRASARDLRQLEAEIAKRFAKFTDPREGVSRWNDLTPILLMPVRLETRFKNERSPAGGLLHELWVRIYPDDCWLDGFDPAMTDSELENVRRYWTSLWRAGGIEAQERAAWRALVESHGSGRAGYLVDVFQPVNPAARPTKAQPEDVILVIATDALPSPAEQAALAAFWREAWLADGDAQATAAARQALVASVGAARADELIASFPAAGFDVKVERSELQSVSAVWLALPTPPETKQSAWSRAPKLTLLPERFVFIGYRGEGPPLVVLGNPVPSELVAGPDPSAPEEDQLRQDESGDLIVPDELAWLSDFPRAVEVGMGFRIQLTEAQASGGFERVLVLGLRLGSSAEAAKLELETLFQHHAQSRSGLALVPQGTPTNNTEATSSGHGRFDDPDASFDARKRPPLGTTSAWLDKKDGQWLAEQLGLDSKAFDRALFADATDQASARALHRALFPATLGYWMETVLDPVFSRQVIERTRDFFCDHVLASGGVPALRIGRQPYGVLPATPWSRLRWLDARTDLAARLPDAAYLRGLYGLIQAVEKDFRAQLANVAFVGKGGDPHQILLDVVGLHSGSVEWSQRFAESVDTLYNRLALQGLDGVFEAFFTALRQDQALQLLGRLGYAADATPKLLELVFTGRHQLLKGGVVDDRPLSESEPIRAYTDAGKNYLEWLIEAAGTSLSALYAQDGFTNDRPPTALLYLLLRHALQLGYHDVGVTLYENAGLYSLAQARAARQDQPFLHVQQANQLSESRYQPLFAREAAITGNAALSVAEFIGARWRELDQASHLREQLSALAHLVKEPTARLERCFADHVDVCTYRLDAWRLGIQNVQLTAMRNSIEGNDGKLRQGIYLGAYAWLEGLKPENKQLTPVRLTDPALIEDFGQAPLERDSTNQGYVHAPSLNHAVTAAVLRNGFISNASAQNRQTLAVNLTSERVRVALGFIEGIRAGQSLGDLLGYQFERGLHDRHTFAEVDKFVYKLRKAFPLRADRLKSTQTTEGVPIAAIEARNVIDGLAFVEHMLKTGQRTYPFGKSTLPSASQPEQDAINAEAERLLDAHDAVADLALAEGVYQAVLGNYERVASTYDAYARGHFPPEPDVIRTPQNGIGLTHRVALHLEAGASPLTSPWGGVPMTPRAHAEPALNRWLASVLPPPNQVECAVTFRRAATGAQTTREVKLDALGLQPIDVIHALQNGDSQAMSELDDRILRAALPGYGARPDAPVTIEYLSKPTTPYSFFELLPLVQKLRKLATHSRPLTASDLSLMNEATRAQDGQPFLDPQRVTLARGLLVGLKAALLGLLPSLEGPLGDLENRRGELLTAADDLVTTFAGLAARAASFGIPQAGWGFAYDFQRRAFAGLLSRAAALVEHWEQKHTAFLERIDEHDALPGTANAQKRFRLLQLAEREITTVLTDTATTTPAQFRDDLLNLTLPPFLAKRAQFEALAATPLTRVADLLPALRALLPLTDFDAEPFSLDENEAEIVRFAEDLLRVVRTLLAEIERKLVASQSAFDEHAAAANPADQVRALERAIRALLGEEMKVFPEFSLSTEQGSELENAVQASQSGELFQYLTAPTDPQLPAQDFPVDTWLYGVARVREKLGAWEQVMQLAGALGQSEPELVACQLPYAPGDRWLGLEFPPDLALTTDRLLYTAHFATPFVKSQRQCGLLLDEWSELIPGGSVDTGIAFHHDRPNSEAPQAFLLLTPAAFQGAWQWADVLDSLHETLELAKQRALEPAHIDALPYAPLLPATVMAHQVRELTIALNLALNNNVRLLAPQG